jgi:hypothetical protein
MEFVQKIGGMGYFRLTQKEKEAVNFLNSKSQGPDVEVSDEYLVREDFEQVKGAVKTLVPLAKILPETCLYQENNIFYEGLALGVGFSVTAIGAPGISENNLHLKVLEPDSGFDEILAISLSYPNICQPKVVDNLVSHLINARELNLSGLEATNYWKRNLEKYDEDRLSENGQLWGFSEIHRLDEIVTLYNEVRDNMNDSLKSKFKTLYEGYMGFPQLAKSFISEMK